MSILCCCAQGTPAARAFIQASTLSRTKPQLRPVMRTGRGNAPAWTIRHTVVRDTPIISRTCRGLMNCTPHLRSITARPCIACLQGRHQGGRAAVGAEALSPQWRASLGSLGDEMRVGSHSGLRPRLASARGRASRFPRDSGSGQVSLLRLQKGHEFIDRSDRFVEADAPASSESVGSMLDTVDLVVNEGLRWCARIAVAPALEESARNRPCASMTSRSGGMPRRF